jgi:hypothetical protein
MTSHVVYTLHAGVLDKQSYTHTLTQRERDKYVIFGAFPW